MFDNRPDKTPAAWNLYKNAKYESLLCGCQTGLSCVAKRAPWTGTVRAARGGLSVSDGCTVLHGGYDLMLLFLHRSMGGPHLILYCHLLAPWACDLCSCQLQLHQLRQPLVNCGYAGKASPLCTSYFGAKVNHPWEQKGGGKNPC